MGSIIYWLIAGFVSAVLFQWLLRIGRWLIEQYEKRERRNG
jgi:hypothetical protein